VRLIAAALLLLLTATSPVLAQTTRRSSAPPRPQNRFYAGVDCCVQAGVESVTDTMTFPLNGETARFSTPYEAKPSAWVGFFFDAHVWQYLSAGIAITGYSAQADTQVTGSIPHPFFFNRARELTGDVAGVERSEGAVHLQLRAQLPLSGKTQVSVFGGPSFYQVDQDVVTSVRWTENYPFDTVSFTSAGTETRSESGTGFNVGADVAYFLGRHFGVGGRVQYSRATVSLTPGSGTGTIDTKVGGFQAGGGVRFRF
jgi:hypothetical protein